MNRALRRHGAAKQAKGGRPAKAPVRPLPRTGGARPTARREGRSFPASLFGWRPRFVMDIVSELRKVVWPSRQDVTHLTVVVLIVSLALGAALGGIDIGFGWLIDNLLLR